MESKAGWQPVPGAGLVVQKAAAIESFATHRQDGPPGFHRCAFYQTRLVAAIVRPWYLQRLLILVFHPGAESLEGPGINDVARFNPAASSNGNAVVHQVEVRHAMSIGVDG